MNKTTKNDFFIKTSISAFIRTLGALSAFFLSIVVGRKLGAEDAGYYFLAFSLVTVISAVSRIGLDNTVIRFTASSLLEGNRTNINSILFKSLFISIFISCISCFLLFTLNEYLSYEIFKKPDLASTLRNISPGIIGLSIFTIFALTFQGLHRIISSVIIINISTNAVLISCLLYSPSTSAEKAAQFYTFSSFITVALGYFIYTQSVDAKKGGEKIEWNVLFQSCLPLWVVVIMTQLTQFSSQFIAGAWVEPEQIAQLAVAQRVAMLTSFILMAVDLVAAPRFAAMYRKNEFKELESLALYSVRLMIVLALPVVIVMLLYPDIIMSIFGEGFSEGALLLQILVLGQFINVATGCVTNLLAMSGHEKDLRNTVLISGPIAIGLALVLVPTYGVIGGAIATAIAVAMQNFIAVWWVKKRLGFNTLAIWK